MKKILLPLAALGVSLATIAQAASSTTVFDFFNGTNKPVLVFIGGYGDPANVPSGIFVSARSPMKISTNAISFTVSVCWTTQAEKWATVPDCDSQFPLIVSCNNSVESPNTVTAFGDSFTSTAPGLICSTLTANKNAHFEF